MTEKVDDRQVGNTVSASVRLEPLNGIPTFYINHIEVGGSPQDFTLIGGRLPGKFTSDQIEEIQSEGYLAIEPEVQIIIPTTLIAGLIRALGAQKSLYESTYNVELKEVRNT